MGNWFEDPHDLRLQIEESIALGEHLTDTQIAALARYQRSQQAYLSLIDLFHDGTIGQWQYNRLLESRLLAVQSATKALRSTGMSPTQAERWLKKG